MEIALCHRIPRERVFYLALSLLLISLLLQAICIGLRSVTGGGGKFKVVSTQDGAIIGYVHVAVLSGMTLQSEEVGCTSSSESVGSSSSCYQSLCSLQLPTFDKKCVQYLSACYGVEICAIIALVFSSLSFLYCLGFSWGKTLLQVDITLLSGLCLPCSFLCAVLIIFFTSVVPAGADAIYMYASSKSEIALEENIRLDFFRGNIINLYVSSACFCFAGFISVLCHGIWWLFFKAHSESDEEECMRDDYAQQKEVLTSHAKAVRAEIKFKGEIDPGFIPPLTTKVVPLVVTRGAKSTRTLEKDDKIETTHASYGKDHLFCCAICLDVASEPVVTRCGHLFCWPCLEQWLYSGKDTFDCPTCKSFVSPDTPGHIIPLYGTSRDYKDKGSFPASSERGQPQGSSSSFTATRGTGYRFSSASTPAPPPTGSHRSQHRRPPAPNVPGPRQNVLRWNTLRTRSLGVQVFCLTCFSSIGIFLTLFLLFVLPWVQSTGITAATEWWRNLRRRREPRATNQRTTEAYTNQRSETGAFWALPAPLTDPIFWVSCWLSVLSIAFVLYEII